MFTLESPHRGDSKKYTQYTIFQYEKEKHPKLSQICSYGIFSKGLKNEFERAMVNEPSVFEPLTFYCISRVLIRVSVSIIFWGWSGGAMVLGKLPVPGRPTTLITVGQGPTALAAGAGWVVWTFFPRLSFLFSYSLSLGDGPI